MLWVLGLAWGNPLDAWGPHVGHGILAYEEEDPAILAELKP